MTKRTTISYPDWLHSRIKMLEGAGIVDSRSEFFVNAATTHLLVLETGADTFAKAEGYDLHSAPSSIQVVVEEMLEGDE